MDVDNTPASGHVPNMDKWALISLQQAIQATGQSAPPNCTSAKMKKASLALYHMNIDMDSYPILLFNKAAEMWGKTSK